MRNSINVVLVDDEDSVREIVHRILVKAGCQVTAFAEAQAALDYIRGCTVAPELLVTDLRMPGMTGSELADAVRLKFPEIRMLFISGYSDMMESLMVRMRQGDRFLAKPFGPKILLQTIQEMMPASKSKLVLPGPNPVTRRTAE
jgi:CheY-like chemotaxis protein